MANVVRFPGEKPPTDGGGPEDPVLIERVARLELSTQSIDKKVSSIELALARIEGQLAQLPKSSDIGELKGKVDSKPNAWQMLGMQLTTLMAGAGIVFAALRLMKP